MKRLIMGITALLLAGCSANRAAAPEKPTDYEVRFGVTPAAGNALQRIALPGRALAALRSPDRADIRIFDSLGNPVAFALAAPPPAEDDVDLIWLEANPFLAPDRPPPDRTDIRFEPRTSITITRDAPHPVPTVGSVMFDTRRIERRVLSMTLDATLPPQQPVTFTIEASSDLYEWTQVGGRTLYRKLADESGAIGSEAIALDDGHLASRYLRVRWSAGELLAPLAIKGATLRVPRAPGVDRRPSVATSPPRLIDAHEVRFALPRPVRLAGVSITPKANETLLPLRILGRNASDQPWTLLGSATLRKRAAEPIALSGPWFSDYRIDVDDRVSGFKAPPELKLMLEPVTLIAFLDGRPPFTLAVGADGPADRFLEVDQLMPGYRPGAEALLPLATVAASPNARIALVTEDDGPFSPKKSLLWGVLVLGVAALGLMVWRLWRPTGIPDA